MIAWRRIGAADSLRRLPRWRRRSERCIADAIIEADPVDAGPLARRIPVAHFDAPARWLFLPHEFQRALHGFGLGRDAAVLPLAGQADVECYGVIERCRRARRSARGPERHTQSHQYAPHCRQSDSSRRRRQSSNWPGVQLRAGLWLCRNHDAAINRQTLIQGWAAGSPLRTYENGGTFKVPPSPFDQLASN